MSQEAERGQLITQLREARLWTRERLAKEAGVSPATITQAEEGRAHIRLSTIGKLAEALEIDPQEILHPPKGQAPPLSALADESEERRQPTEAFWGSGRGVPPMPLDDLNIELERVKRLSKKWLDEYEKHKAGIPPPSDWAFELEAVVDKLRDTLSEVIEYSGSAHPEWRQAQQAIKREFDRLAALVTAAYELPGQREAQIQEQARNEISRLHGSLQTEDQARQ